ncbi:MAG: beta-ketoacyl synthase chain length factor [Myxococcota bacterium]|nr:beta-ketoacyl synthase chain length factor [Myxococcales bacterium]
MRARIDGFAAWSPGLETRASWEAWARAPHPLAHEGAPEIPFIPAAVRRRCTRLTKMMLRSAFEACGETLRADVRTVFASRHGAIHVAVQILASITGGEPVSPMQFSHSVHNAQAGLYSIAAGNREASSSLAGEADTCACAWIEALAHMERAPGAAVLVTIADEPLPPRLLPLVDEPASAYAVSFLLRRADDADPDAIGLRIAPGGAAAAPERSAPLAWPQALELARWWLAGASEPLALGARRRYVFERGGEPAPPSPQ